MRGILYILAAATLWGTTGTSQALAPDSATPLVVGTMRLIVGGFTLLVISGLQHRTLPSIDWRSGALWLATVCAIVYQVTFFAGVALTGVAVGTIVGIGSAPIFAGLLGAWVDGDRLSWRWYRATSLAIIGCLILTLSGGNDVSVNPVGIALALSAGLSYNVFTMAQKNLSRTLPSDTAMALSFCLAALLMSPLLVLLPSGWILTPRGLAVSAHLGIIATGFSYWLFGRGIQTVPVATIGTLTLAEPLTAALLSLLILRESLPPVAFIGIGLLIAGLWLLLHQPKLPQKAHLNDELLH